MHIRIYTYIGIDIALIWDFGIKYVDMSTAIWNTLQKYLRKYQSKQEQKHTRPEINTLIKIRLI
jgi:hypothetical protein